MALTGEQWRRMKWTQNDMAIEGHAIPDERMKRIAEEHYASGREAQYLAALDQAKVQGKKEGRNPWEIYFEWLKAQQQ